MRSVLVLELNEINPDVLRNMVGRGELPAFKRLMDTHTLWSTNAGEDRYENLEPWIQWTTVHTGLTQAQHGAFNLTDGQHIAARQLWDELEERNIACGVVSPMNGRRGSISKGFFVPDPWSAEVDAFPASLSSIYQFLRERVQSHYVSLEQGGSRLAFLREALRSGVPLSALTRLARKYAESKLNPKKKWQLVAEFDVFLLALTLALRKKFNTAYTSVFLNGVAHYQHHYWHRHDAEYWKQKYPVLFRHRNPLDEEKLAPGDDPIAYGMRAYDRMIAKVQRETPDTAIVIATGLSQVPFEGYEGGRGFYLYRPIEHERLFEAIGVRAKLLPLMSRDMMLFFDSAEARGAVIEQLRDAKIGDEPLFSWTEESDLRLFVKIAYTFATHPNTLIEMAAANRRLKFADYFKLITFKTGHHAPRGLLLAPKELSARIPESAGSPLKLPRLTHLLQSLLLEPGGARA